MPTNLRFFAGAARNLEGRAAGEYIEGYTSIIRREPVGVVGQITPWNYPLMMAIWKIGPALAAGNTIVLKPAETTPHDDLQARRDRGRDLAARRPQRDRRPRRPGRRRRWSPTRTSTWSRSPARRETGKWIAKAAADTLKRVHLELGGKAPVIIFDDADMETAMETIAGTGYYNAGQDCTAATRVLAVQGGLRRRRQRARRAGQGLQ